MDDERRYIAVKRKTLYIAAIVTAAILIGGLLAYAFASNGGNKRNATDKISFSEAVGKKAPEFSLEDVNELAIKLSDYKGKIVVLFFNEGSMCYPACWDQIAALASEERFGSDVAALSVVVDQQTTWKQIITKMPKLANAKILFDTTRSVSSAYNVLNLPSSMHPGAYPGHTYIVIDKEGIIRYVYDDPKMAVRNDLIVAEVQKLR